MKTILTSMSGLALLLGISGCLYPFRDWRGDRRGDRYQQWDNRYEQRDNRYEQGHRDQSGRDCWSRDGQVYCRR
jgi:hypothetical protein